MEHRRRYGLNDRSEDPSRWHPGDAARDDIVYVRGGVEVMRRSLCKNQPVECEVQQGDRGLQSDPTFHLTQS
jgi:hypothetical protein